MTWTHSTTKVYRDAATIPVDDRELELARIREEEKTKQKAVELQAECAKDRREKLAKFFSYEGVVAFLGLSFIAVVITLCTLAIFAGYSLWLKH